jgi:hypothetical protein
MWTSAALELEVQFIYLILDYFIVSKDRRFIDFLYNTSKYPNQLWPY